MQREPERLRTRRAEKTDREKEEGGSGRPGRDGVRRQHRGVVSLPQDQFAKLQPTLSGNEEDQSQHTPPGPFICRKSLPNLLSLQRNYLDRACSINPGKIKLQ